MIYDFTTAEMLRLANIKRWGVVEMARPQSVTEHTANVSLLAMGLVAAYNNESRSQECLITDAQQLSLLQACLVHDLPEVYSGDVPAPFKSTIGRGAHASWERERFPKIQELMDSLDPIIARMKGVCDLVEAILFVRKWCVDGRSEMIMRDLLDSLKKTLLPNSNPSLTDAEILVLKSAVETLLDEADQHGGMS